MAGIYSPSVTTYPDGVVTVASTDGTTYNQIITSMGSFIYGVSNMYINANDGSQLLQPIKSLYYSR